MKKTLLLVALALGAGVVLANRNKLTAPTALMLSSPGTAQRIVAKGEAALPAFIAYTDAATLDTIEQLGVRIRTRTASVVTAEIPVGAIDALCNLSGVKAIEAAQPVEYMMDRARQSTRVDEVHTGAAPLNQPYLGEGVIVGVIDGGLDYMHRAFRSTDGTRLRLKRVWDQNATKGTPPEGYSAGAEYTTEEQMAEAKSDQPYFAHGTHVMNIAAGADMADGNQYYGVAREADLVFCTFMNGIDFNANTTSMIDALNYIYSYAESEKKPVVVNMSLGTQMGPHDGTSLIDLCVDELTGPGRIAVGAGGNDGQVEIHAEKTFTEGDVTMLAGLAFKAETQGTCPIDIWGEAGKTMKVQVLTINKETDRPVYSSRTFDCSKTVTQKVVLEKPYDMSSGFFNISTGISPLNGKPNARIDLHIEDFYPEKCLAVKVTGEAGETVHIWTSSTYAVVRRQTPSMVEPDFNKSVAEIGGVGNSIITVGSYTTRQNLTLQGGVDNPTPYPEGERSAFSNCGPTVDGRTKPDVVAPGSQIISALNGCGAFNEGLVVTYSGQDRDYHYGSMLGTSMASPHVAGIVATWLQAAPELTPENIRDVLDHTCTADEFTGQAPNNSYGRGKINAYEGLKYILNNFSDTPTIGAETDRQFSVNVSNGNVTILSLASGLKGTVTVADISGRTIALIPFPAMSFGEERNFTLPAGEKGVYIVNVSAGSQSKTLKFTK